MFNPVSPLTSQAQPTESVMTQMELPARSDWGQPPEQRVAGAAGSIHSPGDLMYANVETSRPGTMDCLNPLRQGEEPSPHPHLTRHPQNGGLTEQTRNPFYQNKQPWRESSHLPGGHPAPTRALPSLELAEAVGNIQGVFC